MRQTMRKIVRIDEEKCDGCGLCIPNCAEGALKIVNGKARLVADNLCDGLGACLGTCPQGAITVEERPADDFDEAAVHRHLHPQPARPMFTPTAHAGGCPGSRMQMFAPAATVPVAASPMGPSRLRQWPVQLALLPVSGPIWNEADVLIAADCVPFAYPDFHEKMLAGKTLAIACPKLDDVQPYLHKLTQIFAGNTIRSVTVVRMEVPCCGGIVRLVRQSLAAAGRPDIPVEELTLSIRGQILPAGN